LDPIQLTHSLQAPGFNPSTYNERERLVSKPLLSKCNLYRYTEVREKYLGDDDFWKGGGGDGGGAGAGNPAWFLDRRIDADGIPKLTQGMQLYLPEATGEGDEFYEWGRVFGAEPVDAVGLCKLNPVCP
jgi:hypothetical protein